MDVSITVCTTCRFGPGAPLDANGRTGGEQLAEALEKATSDHASIRIVRHECLWACRRSCAILIGSKGRTGYLAGDFTPDAAAAEAIGRWALAYEGTEDGAVPYGQWPEGIKGHFIARIPLAGGD